MGMERCKSLAHLNLFFDMYLSYPGSEFCSFLFWNPSGCTPGDGCSGWELGTGSPLVCILNACWARHWGQPQQLDGCSILYLLIWQATFPFTLTKWSMGRNIIKHKFLENEESLIHIINLQGSSLKFTFLFLFFTWHIKKNPEVLNQ